MPHLHLEIFLHLSLGKCQQILTFYLILIEIFLAIPKFYKIQEIEHLFDGPFLQILRNTLQFSDLAKPIILQQKHYLKFFDMWIGLLEDIEIFSCKSFLIEYQSREIFFLTLWEDYLFLLFQDAVGVVFLVLGLFLAVVVLTLPPLHSIFEFSNVIRGVLLCDLSVSVRLIVLPFSLILDIQFLVDLKPSSLFLAVHPFPSVKVSIRV